MVEYILTVDGSVADGIMATQISFRFTNIGTLHKKSSGWTISGADVFQTLLRYLAGWFFQRS